MKKEQTTKRKPILISAMLTLIALLTATLQAAVMPPLLQPSDSQTLWGSYFYGDYQKGEPTRETYNRISSAPADWTDGTYLLVYQASADATTGLAYVDPSASTAKTVTISGSSISDANSAPEINFEAVGSNYYIRKGSNYLYNNNMGWLYDGTPSTIDQKSQWSLSINANGSAELVNINTGASQRIIYSSNAFDMGSGSSNVYLYKKGPVVTTYSVNPATTITNGSIAFSTDGTTFTSSLSGLDGGETIYVKATADAGYELASMTASGITFSGTGDTRTFTMPTSNVTVSATFSQVSYNVTKGTITGGDITLSASTAHYGDVITITPEADDCYETTPTYTVTDAGSNPVAVTGNTFTMPASDVTVSAAFTQKTFEVTLNGTDLATVKINGSAAVTSGNHETANVNCGSSATLTVEGVNPSYVFSGWKTGSIVVSTDATYTFTPNADATYEATFSEKLEFTVTCATGIANGSISADKATAIVGETVTITATPATGYELETLTYTPEGGSAVAISGTTFTMPAANVTVNATFTKACDHYYYLVEEDLDDWTGEYLIVYTTGNQAFNGGLTTLDAANNNIAVTISDNMITRNATTSAASFNIAKDGDYYTVKSASGYYIGVRTANGALNQSTTVNGDYKHTLTRDGSNVWLKSYQGGGSYLEFNKTSGQNRFRYYSVQTSQEPIQLYRKGVMKPVIIPADGSTFISGMQPVTITAPDGVSTIYYTTDGTEPTTSSAQYTSSFTIYATTTVKAIAVNECGEASFVATALIRSADDDIVMTPLSGTYLNGTEVQITSPGAFHYTTDGTEPTTSHGTAVSGTSATIILDSTMTIWAVLDSDATKNAKENYVVPTGTYNEATNPDGIVMNKSVSGNFNNAGAAGYGTGNITLESYVTGNVTVVEGDPDPVDVVLVLDYSNSMNKPENALPGDVLRITALRNAVNEFLQVLKDNPSPYEEAPHRVAFVFIAGPYNPSNIDLGHIYYNKGDNSVQSTTATNIYNQAFFYFDNATGGSATVPSNNITPIEAWSEKDVYVFNSSTNYYDKKISGGLTNVNPSGTTESFSNAVYKAGQIFANNSDEFTHEGQTMHRKRMIVTFADGAPVADPWSFKHGSSCDDTDDYFAQGQANLSIGYINDMKTNYDVDAYSVGIFDGADASGEIPAWTSDLLPDWSEYAGNASWRADEAATRDKFMACANRFFHLLSSNYTATDMCGTEFGSNQGHYISPNNAADLVNAFKGIAQAAGGASASLGSQAIVQDVMTSQFAIPEGTTASSISVKTMDYIGTDPTQAVSWNNEQTLANPNIQFSEDGKTIMVTGFDYASNWVGADESTVPPTYHGKKLIVTIPIAFDPSLTDDDVFHGTFETNAAGSGIYDADGMPVGNFPVPTTPIDHGKITWVQHVTSQPSTWTINNGTVMIGTENDLAWFISYVNGLNGQTAHPAANAKLTADLDMKDYLWVPIGYNNSHRFTGTFDGNGYTIKGVNIPTESAAEYISWRFNTGMGSGTDNTTGTDSTAYYAMGSDLLNEGFFGYAYSATIKNTFLTGGKFVTDTIANVNLGGIVGYSTNNTNVNFAESAIELVLSDKATNGYVGGITGYSTSGCNFNGVMAVGDITINGTAAGAGSISGRQGTIKTFYTNHTISGEGTVTTKNTTGTNGYSIVANEGYTMGTTGFSAPTAYTYGSYGTNNTVSGTPLVDVLNNATPATGFKWMRSTSQAINGDYPIIVKEENDGFAIVNDSEDGKIVRYQEINTLLGMSKYQNANHSVFMYNNDDLSVAPVNTKLYINEHVSMTQSVASNINATVGITLDNSNGTGSNDLHRDWHMFSASIAAGKTGLHYITEPTTYPSSENDLVFGTHYSLVQNDEEVYFPDGITGSIANPGKQFDLYSFYEDQYHWMNLKRNTHHWHQDNQDPIAYTSETTFTPGKGYLVALGDNSDAKNNLMQAKGTLNNGTLEVDITSTGQHLTGYNLLGNPYQSYLDFQAFADNNTNIWSGSDAIGYKSYMVYDADRGGFIEYLVDGYNNSFSQEAAGVAGRYIHPHQGFFIVKNGSAEKARFANTMRNTDATDVVYRNELHYPLVNLFCTDEDGHEEISVIELNRPATAGSLKMKDLLTGKGQMYIHWGDDEFKSIFIDHTPDYVPVWFETSQNGVYTMSWNTANEDFGYIHLIDNLTGADIDCLTDNSYTFESHTTDLKARFRLVFKPLGVNEITNEGGNFAFFNGNDLVVNGEGELSLIDLNGRVLATEHVSGQNSHLALPKVAVGMYLLKLSNANDVKVQKIIVK